MMLTATRTAAPGKCPPDGYDDDSLCDLKSTGNLFFQRNSVFVTISHASARQAAQSQPNRFLRDGPLSTARLLVSCWRPPRWRRRGVRPLVSVRDRAAIRLKNPPKDPPGLYSQIVRN